MQYLKDLYGYNVKFAEEIISVLRKIDQKRFLEEKVSAWGSLRNLVMHLIEAEDYWMNGVIKPEGFHPYNFEDFTDIDSIEARWKSVDLDILTFLEHITPAQFNTSRTVKWDKEYTFPLEKIFQHVYTHTVHTRGQIVAAIRILGGDVPCVDII